VITTAAPPLKARTTPSRQEAQAVTNTTRERRDRVGAFFAAHADRLQRAVCPTARAPEQTIEDACQAAWIILLRHPEITLDSRGFSWLRTVATYEAWRLASNRYETLAGPGRIRTTRPCDGQHNGDRARCHRCRRTARRR
jgi:hypothetical protein